MAQNVIINGVTYQNVPEVDIPLSGGGTAKFMDTSDATATSADMRNSADAYVGGTKITGSLAGKAAATYQPSTSDQTISRNQILDGDQTISAVTVTNLTAANIAQGVTVKIGCAADDDCITSVLGTLASPVISQDGQTKILSIS